MQTIVQGQPCSYLKDTLVPYCTPGTLGKEEEGEEEGRKGGGRRVESRQLVNRLKKVGWRLGGVTVCGVRCGP